MRKYTEEYNLQNNFTIIYEKVSSFSKNTINIWMESDSPSTFYYDDTISICEIIRFTFKVYLI